MAAIRLATATDAAAICAIYRPIVETTVISFETEPPGETEMRRRIRETLHTHPWLVAEHGGEVIGYAYAGPHRSRAAYQWSAEVSVYVHPAHQRQGHAGRLYRALLSTLRLQGFLNAYAGIALPNPASVRLHESLGFRPVGVYERIGFKAGMWHDVGWWQLRLQEVEEEPAPPRSLSELSMAPALADALRSDA